MAVSLPPLNGETGHAPEEKRGTDVHKHNQRRGRLLPWLQPIPQMGPREQGVTRGNTRYLQKQNVHFVTWPKTAGPQMPKYAFLNWCIYPNTVPPIIFTLSAESAPESYSGPPLGVLDHSHRIQRRGPTLVMPWCKLLSFQMCAAYLAHPWPKSCKEPGGCFTLNLISSAGVKQTYLIFPCVCTFSSVFGANLLLLLYFMFHFTSHQFALPYYVYKISPNVYSKK